ncbi:SusC/RagA family TonB-linked outer membrane protein [Parachryseolinea silvisoli]|uniref:SusC/RagA family TonB-linked outer membrane protein n=1 Tax=Parachryseolinea silvisoli TaxID=2873601 RepID=UPI002265F320|nr:SusC/RagA family TonB-linked outer membrane protein [Parachryseolinea silvisoli]MCD9014199.1 SusC/RagA family TonB-linked outer membrane protein [Parachryseolinea silvisoli]
MKHFNSSLLAKGTLLMYMVGASVPASFAQQFASTASARALRGMQVNSDPGFVDDQQVSLKEALNDLKKRYNIRFAYRAGLLEGKTVSAALLSENLTPEETLEKMLDHCKLQFKKINKKQFSIFAGEEPATPFENAQPVAATALAAVTTTAVAPNFTLTGTVISGDDNTTMPGVNVVVKGTTIGTTTDGNGKYTLSVPDEGGVLVLSFIGYATQEVPFTSAQTVVDVTMQVELSTLGEVVVTALGIEKDKNALGYSVTEVKGEEFTQAREVNVANSLSGKIAGLNVTGASTGPGGSSRVLIRGNGSLTGNSQPLYVINGMPIDNSVPGGSTSPNGANGNLATNIDRGDGIAAINPDDIESITVLKGGTAGALYGSRGSNGVILITTKKGTARKGIGVEYNSTYTLDRVAVFPDWQYEYGQGEGGVMPTTQAEAISSGRRSFGARIDGNTNYVAADGKNHPYSAQKDNLKNFYETGKTFTNTLAFSGGNEAILYRLSLSDLDSKSILPNTKYNRKTANLNLSGKLSDKLRVEAVAQYTREVGQNRPNAGDALGNPNWTPYEVANTVDVRWLDPGYDANNNELAWNDAPIATNGYFVINKVKENDDKNRFIGQASVSYDILKNLTAKAIITRDFYSYDFKHILPTGTLYQLRGQYTGMEAEVSETNSMVTLSYKAQLSESIGMSLLGGFNTRRAVEKRLDMRGTEFTQPYFYAFTNLNQSSVIPFDGRSETNSVFGSIDLDYKGYLFLTATTRQDWFSTLSPKDNGIFYPSVGASFVLSDAITMPTAFNLVKFRASWAQVGGGSPDPYQINLTYSAVPSSTVPLQNVTEAQLGVKNITNAQLKPFTSTTTEVGFNVQILDNRLGFDVALYDRRSTDDIVSVPVSLATGYNNAVLNSGELSNRGIEVLVNATPAKVGAFTWDMSYNFAYNKSEVLKLADGIQTLQIGASANGNATIRNNVGQPYGGIYGYRMLRNAQGVPIFDMTANLPGQTDINQKLGNGVPPITMGLTNDFRYKNFSLNVLLDGKFGHDVFSVTEVYAARLGLHKMTLEGRENGLVLKGVTPEGTPHERTIAVANLRSQYYNSVNRYTEMFVHDASFVKLRQVILSYRLPVEKLKFVKIQSATLSLVGRNLAILYKKTDNFDPEQSLTNGAAQGIESIGLPRTRSYGVNLIVKF